MTEYPVEASAEIVVELNKKKSMRVLHVDDELGLLKVAKQCLEMERDFEVDTALSAQEAIEKIRRQEYDVIVSDYQMPGKDGLDLLRELREKGNSIPFIMFTGKGREEVAIRALNLGANQYLNKTGDPQTVYAELAHSIKEVVRIEDAEKETKKTLSLLAATLDSTTDGILVVDRAGRIASFNRKFVEMWRIPSSTLISKVDEQAISFICGQVKEPEKFLARIHELNTQPEAESFDVIEFTDGRVFERSSQPQQTGELIVGRVWSFRDVTERKKKEDAIRESEEKLKAILSSSPDAITVFDLAGNVIELNQAALTLHGFGSKEEIIGKSSFDFVSAKDQLRAKEVFEHTLKEGCVKNAEFTLLTMDGHEFLAELSASVVSNSNGNPTAIAATTKDITKRKEAERKLIESEEKFRGIFESANDYIIHIDTSGRICDVNENALRAFAGRKEDLIGKRFTDLDIFPSDMKAFWDLFPKTLNGNLGKKAVFEVCVHNKKGQQMWLECSQSLIKNSNEVTGLLVIARDITDRKKAELGFIESQQKFEALFRGNPEATVYTNHDMLILDINPRFTRLFGYSLDEVKGKHINDVVVPENLATEGKMLNEKALDGYVYHDTVRTRKDGSLIPVSISAAPISMQGQLMGFIGVYKDISQQKSSEEKLAIMNEKLRVIGSLTRHDVRNKLSIITGNTYLNKKRLADRPEIVGSLKDVESACNMIVRIFDFASDYERLGVEKLSYVDMGDAVQKAVSFFSDLKGVKVANECYGLSVLADSLLRQLLYNLIDNSLKYGQQLTCIKIHYERYGDALRLIYQDDGVGIPEEVRPKIFDEGYTTGKGSGYGLFLIKKMVEVYGWTIEETGEQGKGAQFTITIPKTNANGKENYHLT